MIKGTSGVTREYPVVNLKDTSVRFELKPLKEKVSAKVCWCPDHRNKPGHHHYKIKAKIEYQNISAKEAALLTKAEFEKLFEVSLGKGLSEHDQKKHPIICLNYHPLVTIPSPKEIHAPQSSSMADPLPPQKKYDAISISNAQELALAIKQEEAEQISPDKRDRLLKELKKKIVDAYLEHNRPSKERILELTQISECLDHEDARRIINQVLVDIRENPLTEVDLLLGLIEVLKSIQKLHYKHVILESKNKNEDPANYLSNNLLTEFNGNDFVGILCLFRDKLDEYSSAQTSQSSYKQLVAWLETYNAVLELMEIIQVKNIERDKYYLSFTQSLARFLSHANFEVAYQAVYGLQLFTHIKDDESTLHAIFRHATHLVQGLYSLYGCYEEKSISKGIDGIKSILKAATFDQTETGWFAVLFSLRQMIQGENPQFLHTFSLMLDNPAAKENLKRFYTTNPFFIGGFVEMLKRVIALYGESDPQLGFTAISLLQRIYLDNLDKKDPRNRNGWFTVEIGIMQHIDRFVKIAKEFYGKGQAELGDKYFIQLRNSVFDLLKQYAATHPVLHSSAAKIIREINPSLKLDYKAPEPELTPDTLFNEAVSKVAPWHPGLRDLREAVFTNPQKVQEHPYYLPPKVKEVVSSSSPKFLMNVIEDFLQDTETSAILIEGVPGAGKSLSVLECAGEVLEKHSSLGFIPIVIPLGTYDDPKEVVVKELEKYKLDDYRIDIRDRKHFLSNRRFLVFFDAIDELKAKIEKDVNLFIHNLKGWKDVKVIYTCRKGYFDDNTLRINYLCPNLKAQDLKTFQFVRLDQQDLKELLDKYIEGCQKEKVPLIWNETQKYLDYLKNLDGSVSDMLKEGSRLLFRFMADTLPYIVVHHLEKGEKQDNFTILEKELYETAVCLYIQREVAKSVLNSVTLTSAEEYLKYAVNLATKMEQYARDHNKPYEYQTWFSPNDPYFKELNPEDKDNKLLSRGCPLIKNDKKWGFIHNSFYTFFLTLKPSDKQNELTDRINGNDFEFNKILEKAKRYKIG